MENLEALLHGFTIALSGNHIFLMLIGVLLGILVGEQVIPVGKQVLAGSGLAAAWRQARCAPHIFGLLPGRHESAADVAVAAFEEKRS